MMGKKNSAQATGSNHGRRGRNGGRGGSRNARAYMKRDRYTVDEGEGRPDSVIGDENEREDQLSNCAYYITLRILLV